MSQSQIIRRCLAYSVMLILFSSSHLYATIVSKEINCSDLRVGEAQYVEMPVTNTDTTPWVVEKVSVCCGNPKPTISTTTIQPGSTAQLKQLVQRMNPGPYKIITRVLMKHPQHRVFTFNIKGQAIQPISASIGWIEKKKETR